MRAAKSIDIVHHICQVFEEETTHHKETKKYSIRSGVARGVLRGLEHPLSQKRKKIELVF